MDQRQTNDQTTNALMQAWTQEPMANDHMNGSNDHESKPKIFKEP